MLFLYDIPCDKVGAMHKALPPTEKRPCLTEKHLCDGVVSWASHFSHVTPFLLEKMTNYSYGDLETCQVFS